MTEQLAFQLPTKPCLEMPVTPATHLAVNWCQECNLRWRLVEIVLVPLISWLQTTYDHIKDGVITMTSHPRLLGLPGCRDCHHTCVFDTPLRLGACGHSDNLRRVGSRFHSWWMFVPLVTLQSKLWWLRHTAHPAREDFQLHSTIRNKTVMHTVQIGVLMLD